MRAQRSSLLAGFLLVGAAVPRAAAEAWQPMGPPGGDVRSLAADPRDPRVVYLGTADGVLYRSADAGSSWTRLSPGFPQRGMSLDDLVVGPDGTLFVAYWEVQGSGGGVARSTDGGRTFSVPSGLAGQGVRALAQAASAPQVLVAGTLGGVFRTEDAGATWARISPEGHEEIRNVNSVAIDPRDHRVVYIGTWHLPWKTSDGGVGWRPVKTGMIDDSDVMTLNLDRRAPDTVFATACSGIYRSLNAGGLWSRIRGIPSSSRRTRAFAQDPATPDTLFAGTTEGLWRSDDSSASWRLLTAKDLVVNAVLPLPGGVVLLGTDGAGVL
ncbi:MAG TPA: transcriptional regulator, partial [Vicinamibacteria bacterium]